MSVIDNAVILPGYKTVPEVAALLGMSRQAVHKKINTGRDPEQGGLGTEIYKIVNSSNAQEGILTRPIYLVPEGIVNRAIAYQQRGRDARLAAVE
jgi:predicted transcriptional regulator